MELTTTDEAMLCTFCGNQTRIKNPHPEAGKVESLCTIGAVYECVTCLVATRHQWSRRALKAESENRKFREFVSVLVRQWTREERAARDAHEFEDEDNWADDTTFAEAYDSIIADARRFATELGSH